MLQAKLHRVRVTRPDVHYEGSCGIDELLLEAFGMREFQYIEIYKIGLSPALRQAVGFTLLTEWVARGRSKKNASAPASHC